MINKNEIERRPIILYGNGNSNGVFRSYVLSKLEFSKQPRIVAVVDKKISVIDPISNEYCEPWIFEPDIVKTNFNIMIVICIGDIDIAEDVRQSLLNAGYLHVVKMYDFEDFHCAYFMGTIEEASRDISSLLLHNSNFFQEKLEDDLSREVFDSFINTYNGKKTSCIPKSSKGFEQIAPDIRFIDSNMSCISMLLGGAYDGELVNRLACLFPQLKGTIFLVEPNLNNYQKILKDLKQTRSRLDHILLPLALGDGLDAASLSGDSVTSRIAKDFSPVSYITRVPIDLMLPNFQLTHILADVEGAEKDLLLGARQQIKNSHPNLCLAAYHFPTDIITLPLILNSFYPKYRFFYRNYSGFNTDTLLYAVS